MRPKRLERLVGDRVDALASATYAAARTSSLRMTTMPSATSRLSQHRQAIEQLRNLKRAADAELRDIARARAA